MSFKTLFFSISLGTRVQLPKIAPSTHAHFFLMAPLFINAGEGPIASFVAASENLHSRSNENLISQIELNGKLYLCVGADRTGKVR